MPRDLSGGGTLRDRRHIRRQLGSTFDNVIAPPIEITPPPTTPPDPPDPPVVRGNFGQQRSAYVHALNAARQETHGHKVTVTSADPSKVQIDGIDGNVVLFTVLDENAVVDLSGDVGGVAIPTVKATGPDTVLGLVGQWQSDVGVTTVGSEVTAIADQMSSGNNIVKIDATGPTLVANAINGLPAIKSAGLTTRLSHAISQLNGKSSYTLVLVRTPYDQLTASALTLAMGLEDGVGPQLNIGQGDAGDFRVGGFWNVSFPNTNAVYRGNSLVNLFDIIIASRSGTTVTFYKNGARLTPSIVGSGAAIPNPSVYLGGDRAGNTARGMWAQARLYDHALTDAQALTISQILGAKYAIPVQAVAGTALNRTGWTVSAWNTCGGGFAETSAIDGNYGSRFGSCANTTAGTSWFKIDLGSAQLVGGVMLENYGGGWFGDTPTIGDVQWSDDNTTWTTVASWHVDGTGEIIASWTPSSHRYWRLLAQSGTVGGGWWSIGELNLYSDRAP